MAEDRFHQHRDDVSDRVPSFPQRREAAEAAGSGAEATRHEAERTEPGSTVTSRLKTERIGPGSRVDTTRDATAQELERRVPVPELVDRMTPLDGWELGSDARSLGRTFSFPDAASARHFAGAAVSLATLGRQRPELDLRDAEVHLRISPAGRGEPTERLFALARTLDSVGEVAGVRPGG